MLLLLYKSAGTPYLKGLGRKFKSTGPEAAVILTHHPAQL